MADKLDQGRYIDVEDEVDKQNKWAGNNRKTTLLIRQRHGHATHNGGQPYAMQVELLLVGHSISEQKGPACAAWRKEVSGTDARA